MICTQNVPFIFFLPISIKEAKMARTEKPFRLRKRGTVWYYKTPTMQNFRTTEETSRAKAESETTFYRHGRKKKSLIQRIC